MQIINSFTNEYFFLSNFYECPVTYKGLTFLNNEAAFQAEKCIDIMDKVKFCNLNPSEAKKLGRQISLRKNWEDIKVSVMRDIVYAKFTQNEDLQELLLNIFDAYLEEGNDWNDKIWGTVNGVGRNLLGQILMETRELLEREKENKDLE